MTYVCACGYSTKSEDAEVLRAHDRECRSSTAGGRCYVCGSDLGAIEPGSYIDRQLSKREIQAMVTAVLSNAIRHTVRDSDEHSESK